MQGNEGIVGRAGGGGGGGWLELTTWSDVHLLSTAVTFSRGLRELHLYNHSANIYIIYRGGRVVKP